MVNKMSEPGEAYKRAGVDIDSGNRAVELMRAAVQSTHGPRVVSGTGLFGGMYALGDDTVLVASTDSVGTKLRLSSLLGRHEWVGIDLVNHCVNDVLTTGARPLFFLDYYASSRTVPEVVAGVVEGLAQACREAGCALLGGETAELPGMYAPGEYDIAGFVVGSVRREDLLDGARIKPGDMLLGLPSAGLHTNGFSLVHSILTDGGAHAVDIEALQAPDEELGAPLADLLLEPHRSYLGPVTPLIERRKIKGIAHITGGGLMENVPRVLPEGLSARIDTDSWTPAPIFGWLQRRGDVSRAEMFRVFNMGAGLVLVVAADDAQYLIDELSGAWVLGEVVESNGPRVQLAGESGA